MGRISSLLDTFSPQSTNLFSRLGNDRPTALLGQRESPVPSPLGSLPSAGDYNLSVAASSVQMRLDVQAISSSVVLSQGGGAENTVEHGEELAPSLAERLEQVAPELRDHILALRDLVARFDPDRLESFDEFLTKIADYWSGVQGVAGGGGPDFADLENAVQVRRERMQIAIEQSVTQVEIQMSDGTVLTAQSVRQTISAEFEVAFGKADPLVLDLNGNGVFETTTAQDGHDFDIKGDGNVVRSATAAGGDGMLVLDRNGNGRIDNGAELFGDQNGAAHGFAELARFDHNHDGQIDENDPVFNRLQVFQDANRNGATDDGELATLSQAGIARLMLNPAHANGHSNGNQVLMTSQFVRHDGSTGKIGDLLFNYLG